MLISNFSEDKPSVEIKHLEKVDDSRKNEFMKEIKFKRSKLELYLKKENGIFPENFELGEFIGSGAESLVFKAESKKTKKEIIAKMLYRKKGEKTNVEEIEITKKLKNKNIIESYGAFPVKQSELDCILLEDAKYGDLRNFSMKLLKKAFLTESLLCYICYQILNGLKYIHLCKIVHFDLKPQNIVIDEYLNVKIIDFSVSLHYGKRKDKRIKLRILGTSFYIAPELIKEETIDIKDLNKVDLYSLGVMLYNLAYGNYPYGLKSEDSKNYYKILDEIEKNNLEFPNEENFYSPYFNDFLKKILEKDTHKRIHISEAMEHYWVKGANILMNEPIQYAFF